MKEIAVISGKGGTGKTVIAGSFASLAKSKVMVDSDVDAADLHLLLDPTIKETHEFSGGKTALIDEEICTRCEKCQEVCRFEAIGDFVVDPISCEGCGVCFRICSEKAVRMVDDRSGRWFVSETRYGPFVHAKLGLAEENSGKLVTVVRQNARRIAGEKGKDLIIIDGPPGIGCPVIASLSGVDIALIVTEPTLSGIHDLDRIAGVAHHFGTKSLVCINKYDLNPVMAERIEKYCHDKEIELIGRVPFDTLVVETVVRGVPVVEYSDNDAAEAMKSLWRKILEIESRCAP